MYPLLSFYLLVFLKKYISIASILEKEMHYILLSPKSKIIKQDSNI